MRRRARFGRVVGARAGRVTVTVASSGKPVTIEGLGFSKRP